MVSPLLLGGLPRLRGQLQRGLLAPLPYGGATCRLSQPHPRPSATRSRVPFVPASLLSWSVRVSRRPSRWQTTWPVLPRTSLSTTRSYWGSAPMPEPAQPRQLPGARAHSRVHYLPANSERRGYTVMLACSPPPPCSGRRARARWTASGRDLGQVHAHRRGTLQWVIAPPTPPPRLVPYGYAIAADCALPTYRTRRAAAAALVARASCVVSKPVPGGCQVFVCGQLLGVLGTFRVVMPRDERSDAWWVWSAQYPVMGVYPSQQEAIAAALLATGGVV